jgi:RalA-binding protein 1
MEMPDQKEKMAALGELVERLPQANAALLKYLIAFLIRIIDNADVNKMTVRNVGIVFSPTLNIPAPVFAMFLQNYQAIFGIDPSEYELPLTEPEFPQQERRPSLPSTFQERRPSEGRPSTSHSDSPHRLRLMESLDMQGNRGTPTPPPMSMQQMAQMNAAMHSRSTPTPPPQRPIMYDSPGQIQYQQQQQQQQYQQQQYPPQQQQARQPAYENGFAMPPGGFDPSQVGPRPSPGYDRPLYENGLTPAPYEQPYRSRRESSMFMGNLSQQTSKSRLREEAPY